jgi:hypothetical protein
MYVGNGQIAMASIDEHGHASGQCHGVKGESTGGVSVGFGHVG